MTLSSLDLTNNYDYLFKIVFLGNPGVGKTSLMSVFMDPKNGYYADGSGPSLRLDFKVKTMEVEGAKVKMQIWDQASAASRPEMPINPMYVRGASGVIVVYDVDDKKSFDDVNVWLDHLSRLVSIDHVSIVLVGNKTDQRKPHAVGYWRAKEVAERLGLVSLQTSARDDINVQQTFQTLAKDILKRKKMPAATTFKLNNAKRLVGIGAPPGAAPMQPVQASDVASILPAGTSTFKHEPIRFELPDTPDESSRRAARGGSGGTTIIDGDEDEDEDESEGKEHKSCAIL